MQNIILPLCLFILTLSACQKNDTTCSFRWTIFMPNETRLFEPQLPDLSGQLLIHDSLKVLVNRSIIAFDNRNWSYWATPFSPTQTRALALTSEGQPYRLQQQGQDSIRLTVYQNSNWEPTNINALPPDFQIIDFLFDQNNQAYIATSQGVFFAQGTRWQLLNTPFSSVQKLAFDTQNRLWILRTGAASTLAFLAQNQWQQLPELPQNLQSIAFEGSNIYLGGFQSMLHYPQLNATPQRWDASNSPLQTAATALAAHEDKIWIATRNGLLMKNKDNAWQHFTEQNSTLTSNFVQDVAFDNEGTLWASFSAENSLNYTSSLAYYSCLFL